jgi:Spumavirus aspartic protease (A9)
MLEPVDIISSELVFSFTVVSDKVGTGKVPIQVINLSSKDIELPAKKHIAKFFPLGDVIDKDNPKNDQTKLPVEEQIDKVLKSSNLPEGKKHKLKELLTKYKELFKEPTILKQANVPPHPIHTTTTRPVAS